MKAPDKIYLERNLSFPDKFHSHWFKEDVVGNGIEYIRKDALLKILTNLRDDAGVRDDQYEKDAILEYNLYDELVNAVNEM